MRLSMALGAALVSLCLGLTGCGALGDDSDGVTVAVGFYPLQYVAERVAGDHAEVTTLAQPGADAHDLEIGVQQTALIADADLVVRIDGFQPAVDDAVAANGSGADLDAADVVDLRAADESEDEHAAHEGEGEGHDHDHGEADPHFWLDPLRMAALGDAVAAELAEIDPGNADAYRDNAAALRTDLEALDREFVAGLAQCERDTVVVAHDAFGYLEQYGLHTEPIAGLTPDAEPTPAHLAALQELIRDDGITTVFHERTASSKMGDSLAADLDVATAVLDPVETLTDETADEDYVSLMRSNLAALRTANDCA